MSQIRIISFSGPRKDLGLLFPEHWFHQMTEQLSPYLCLPKTRPAKLKIKFGVARRKHGHCRRLGGGEYEIYMSKARRWMSDYIPQLQETYAHELIHVEQYENGLLDWDNVFNTTTWRGKPYHKRTPRAEQPWEIEAEKYDRWLAMVLRKGGTTNPMLNYLLEKRKKTYEKN